MIPEHPFYAGLMGGVAFSIVLGLAGGLLTRISPWYHALRKPSWKPPDWAFGPVWTTIFLLLTLAIAYAWEAADASQRGAMLLALGVNGVLNIAWSGIFFVMRAPRLAFLELVVFWISIVALLAVMAGISRISGLLILPYLAWVTTAGILNFQIVRLNRL